MDAKQLLELQEISEHILFTGSRVICDPPVLDTDEDVVIFVDDWVSIGIFIKEYQYSQTSSDEYEQHHEFETYRNPDNINLIVVEDLDLFNKWTRATVIAKGLNLIKKSDRIKLFQIVFREDDYAGTKLILWLRKWTISSIKEYNYG